MKYFSYSRGRFRKEKIFWTDESPSSFILSYRWKLTSIHFLVVHFHKKRVGGKRGGRQHFFFEISRNLLFVLRTVLASKIALAVYTSTQLQLIIEIGPLLEKETKGQRYVK